LLGTQVSSPGIRYLCQGEDTFEEVLTKTKGKETQKKENNIYFYSGIKKHRRVHAGVAIAVHEKWKNNIKKGEGLNERLIKMELNLKGHLLVIVAVYGPTHGSNINVKKEYIDNLISLLSDINPRKEVLLLGDFNARVGKEKGDSTVGEFGKETINRGVPDTFLENNEWSL
ncbi:hypothetical protein ILUMI_24501, partial [Ignelater luminosus]